MGDQLLNIGEYLYQGVETFWVMISEEVHGILSITQKLDFIENIFQKLNNFEMVEYQH